MRLVSGRGGGWRLRLAAIFPILILKIHGGGLRAVRL
jgi:hypothetical protein